MTTKATAVVVTALAMTLSLSAQAQSAADRARRHFEAGQVEYTRGDFAGAVREFAAGYKLAPQPEFLVNMGQAYRRLGELDRAREMYARYLDEAPEGDFARPQVEKLLAEVERALAQAHDKPPPPPPSPVEGDEGKVPKVQLPVSGPPIVPDHHPSFLRRNWWLAPVAAVAVTGLVVAIYFGTRPVGPNCSSASLGCLPVP